MKILRFLWFIIFYLYEIVLSNMRVAWDVLTPKHYMKPAIVSVKIGHLSDLQIMLLTNLITMTPGTLSLDVSEDKEELFIHSMYLENENQFIEDIQANYIDRIKELMS